MAEHDDAGITPAVWNQIVELGWTGLLVPERNGGLGLGVVDAVVVQEEMGRVPFPGPFFSSAILATLAARALGLDERLAALATGQERGAVALDEAGTGDPLERVRVRADGRGNSYRLDGVKPMVMDAHSADWVLVPARTREGLRTFCVTAADAQLTPSLDLTRKFAARRVRPHGRAAGGPSRRPDGPVATRARRRGGPARGRDDRRRRGRQRARARVRPSADRVRPAAVEVPSDAAQGRRHAPPDRDGAGRRALRGVGIGCRRA